MKKLITILFILVSLFSFAQPGGYTAGTFVNWNFDPGIAGARDHGFFKAVGFDAAPDSLRRVLIHFEGDGETNSAGLTTQAPGKYLNDAGTNWDGKVVRANGDTIKFCIMTIFNTHNYNPSYYAADINYFFANVTNIPDTSKHNRYAISGFSGGPGRMWGTMLESGFVYANVFGHTMSVSCTSLGTDVTSISAYKRNKVHRNGDDANGGTPEYASDDLFTDLSGYKSIYKPASTGQGHSADSAMSIYGVGTASLTDSSKSWWRLIAEWQQPPLPPYPAASPSPRITVNSGMIFNVNGLTNKSIQGLFDGDTTTTLNKNGVAEDAFILPYSSFVVLDSVYQKFQLQTSGFGSSGANHFTMNLYDSSKTLLLSKSIFQAVTGTWQNIYDIDTTIKVRFIEIAASTLSDVNIQIKEIKIYGVSIAKAPSIYPGTAITPLTDLGKYAHGANVGDDHQEDYLLGSPGVKTVDKIAKSLRLPFESWTWDYIPDGYTGELAAQPLWLGRFGTDYNTTRNQANANSGRFKLSLEWLGGQPSIKELGAIEGVNTANNTLYLGTLSNGKYMDAIGADSTLSSSWDGAAELMYKKIAFFGSNTSADTTGISVLGGSKTVGRNMYRVFEIGNEVTFNSAPRYLSPKVYYVMMKKVYTRGKQADPNAKMYLGALTYMHTDYWRGLYFYHYWNYGASATIPFDGICMNLYINDDYDGQGSSSAANAIPPERWRLYNRLTALKADFDLMFPNRPLKWTESGFNTTDVSPWGVPTISGKTREQTSGDWLLRTKAISQTVRLVEEHDIYSYGELGGYIFDSMALSKGNFDGGGAYIGTTIYPKGYAAANMVTIEADGGYNWFSTVITNGDSTGVWVTKLDHATLSTKKLYKVWKGTSSNSTTSSYVVNVGGTATAAILYTTDYSSFTPTSSSLTITGGNVTVPTVTEGMQWIEVTYSSGDNPQRVRNKKFKRVRSN